MIEFDILILESLSSLPKLVGAAKKDCINSINPKGLVALEIIDDMTDIHLLIKGLLYYWASGLDNFLLSVQSSYT